MATSQDIHSMKLPELKELARQLGLRGISGMRKPVLIETIEAARSGGKAPEGVTVGKPKAAAAVAKGGQATDQQQPTKQETDSSAEGGQETTDTKGSEESKDDRPVGDLFDVLGIDDHKSGHSEHRTRFPHTVADEENVVISRRRHRSTDSSRGFHSNRGRNEHEHDEERAGSGSVRNLDDILAALPSRNDRPRRRSYEDRGEEGRDYRHNGYDRRNRGDRNDRNDRNDRRNRNNHRSSGRDRDYEPRENFKPEDLVPVAGIVDVLDSYAFVRTSGYLPGPNDVYISMGQVKKYGLRKGDAVHGSIRPPREGEHRNQRQKFVPLQAIDTINGMSVEEAAGRPHFNKLTPLYPQERMRMETQPKNITGRLIDIVAPIGKGQRGLIVSPPKAGKTLTLQSIANSITANNPEVHLMVVLVDERPEEVTDMERTVQGEVISSTFDRPASDHTTVAELAIERAKRLVELGQDVVVLLDSMTRLARAYNISAPASGRILSGGVDAQALYPPKRFFGAARNIENGGSLTIISSALVETGSKMDEVIFEEFKGTGNMELRLTRDLADKRMFPAIDINASGTRREELITAPEELAVVYRLRRLLGGMETEQAYQTLVPRLKKTATNRDFLSAINQSMLAQK
ncbi:transcription termination factor Rho [Bifidobacterium asteroides]|uniref:Transcription termination factor Rho n=2 Tax=Bifidobacterium asteroides TaxID=1684 RepID=A0A6N7TTJ3_9BIFI|nr:transcription termination factor Rho [Bifidobacterium asteroides]MSD90642.1 transcription termination factor Rho [Bifidobacterium asteroides]